MSLEASRQLVERLLSPNAYPHPVRGVELKETHISWVILTGDYAYKVKKPVALDFLDFSTLERRRFFCEEELRLNQKFAPEIYLDVVPIHGPHDSPRMGGGGDAPIEYAVRLKQFAKGTELRDRLERDTVSEAAMQAFGQRLADLHAAAATSREFGSAEQTRATLMRNVEELGRTLTRRHAEAERLSKWLDDRSRRLAPLMDSRRDAGKIRECHGDLHAGNVVLLKDAWAPFDCIEFDPALRFIDVLNDASFLMMDLIARDHAPLAYAFINGWLESSGDYDAAPLLGMFETHRALVRAKVAAIDKNDGEVDRYLGAATRICGERQPTLIVTCGLSGSGKTWLSTRVMTAFGALRVRSDVERKRMAGLRANESSRSLQGQNIYTLEFNDRVYRRLIEIARTTLASGENVIIDAASLKRVERESFVALASELRLPVSIIRCTAPLDVLRKRLTDRQAVGKDASEADVEVLERQIDRWESFTERERPHVFEIDTSTPDPVLRAVEALREARSPA